MYGAIQRFPVFAPASRTSEIYTQVCISRLVKVSTYASSSRAVWHDSSYNLDLAVTLQESSVWKSRRHPISCNFFCPMSFQGAGVRDATVMSCEGGGDALGSDPSSSSDSFSTDL